MRDFGIQSISDCYDVPVVNVADRTLSDTLNELCRLHPKASFAVGWNQLSNLMFVYSLRSIGNFDVSAFAKKYGGGGHKNASGFISAEQLF
jgi:nanoRNase/pAp phosphatase (c-di-AMP/oligoRNAs hydrolase)